MQIFIHENTFQHSVHSKDPTREPIYARKIMTPGHVGAAYPRPIMLRSVRPPSALCSSSASSESIGISTPTCTPRQRKRAVSQEEETTSQRALFPSPISTALWRNSFKQMKTHSLFIVPKQHFCSYKPFCVSKTSDFHALCNRLL
jgi:hypothetical protein